MLRAVAGLTSVTPIQSSQIQGTTTNDNAAAGIVGEYISSTVLLGAAVALTTATPANITLISLTAGDWDVWGTVASSVGGATAKTLFAGCATTTSATLATNPNNGAFFIDQNASSVSANETQSIGMMRLSIATTTTVYLVARADFTGGIFSAFGFIGARRVR